MPRILLALALLVACADGQASTQDSAAGDVARAAGEFRALPSMAHPI